MKFLFCVIYVNFKTYRFFFHIQQQSTSVLILLVAVKLKETAILCKQNVKLHLTLEIESLMPLGMQGPPLDLCLELLFFIGQQTHPDVWVAGATQILRRQLLRLKYAKHNTVREQGHIRLSTRKYSL